jgi:hypothetical protein
MACRNEIFQGEELPYCPIRRPIDTDRTRAVLRAHLVDEIAGSPVDSDTQVSADSELLTVDELQMKREALQKNQPQSQRGRFCGRVLIRQ